MNKSTLFSIRVPNQINVLAGLTNVLNKGGVNLIGLVADAGENSFTFVRFITDTPVDAVLILLKKNNLEAYTSTVFGLELNSKPGYLDSIIKNFGASGINIRTVLAAGTTPYLWIEFSDPVRAEVLLKAAATEPVAA